MPQIIDAIKSQGRREGKQSGYPTGMLSVFGNVEPKPQLGISHSLKAKATMATLPTPPSQRAANHSRRCASGRGFC
jgi:hypothetical protein